MFLSTFLKPSFSANVLAKNSNTNTHFSVFEIGVKRLVNTDNLVFLLVLFLVFPQIYFFINSILEFPRFFVAGSFKLLFIPIHLHCNN